VNSQREVLEILDSGKLSGFRGTPEGADGGLYVQQLEQAFRDYLGVKYAFAMQSATAALHVACICANLKRGYSAIVTPYSFASSASCVLMVDAEPIFADIDEDTFCMKPTVSNIQENTTTIIPVHLTGHPADMDYIMEFAKENGLFVIEDAAQALGATYKGKKVGTIGDCGVFSFNQSKPVSSGEGGMFVTNNDQIARLAKALRNHAEVSDPELEIVGYNYRMCEVEAAIVLEQFRDLDFKNQWRNRLTNYMSSELSKIQGFTPPVIKPDCTHVFYTYAVKFDENKVRMTREQFQKEMKARGIYMGSGYVKPLYRLPVFGSQENLCPVAERMWAKELLVTDIFKYPMTIADCDEVLRNIKEVIDAY
jgi:dTDP-4-amino-4,6-dideoxygalactose transaminase